jgi:hypothetical protein
LSIAPCYAEQFFSREYEIDKKTKQNKTKQTKIHSCRDRRILLIISDFVGLLHRAFYQAQYQYNVSTP